jgi:hypothetical protein
VTAGGPVVGALIGGLFFDRVLKRHYPAGPLEESS